MRKNATTAQWVIWILFVLAISSACQLAAQPTVSPAPFPTFTSTSSPAPTLTNPILTATVLPTATVSPTPPPGMVLSPTQAWLMYHSKPGLLTFVNQDGSGFGYAWLPILGMGGSFECRSYGNLPFVPGTEMMPNRMSDDGSTENRMLKSGQEGVYVFSPPGRVSLYVGWEYCQERGIGFRWKGRDDLLTIVGEPENIPTLFIYEMPSMKVRERFPLVTTPEITCEGENLDLCWLTHKLTWSADGRYLAFTAVGKSGSNDLYVYDSVTRTTRQLTSDIQWIASFWWSPDASLLLFTQTSGPDPNVSCVTSVSVVSRASSRIREIYKPSDLPNDTFMACWQGLYKWVDNTRFLISDGGVRTMHDTGVSHMRLVDVATGDIKTIFDDRIDGIIMDGQKKALVIYTSGHDKYDMGIYLVPIARPTPKLVFDGFTAVQWDDDLQKFTASDVPNCKDQPHTVAVFDLNPQIRCITQPTWEPYKTPTAEQRNVSPDKKWRVALNETNVTLEGVSDKTSSLVLNAPGTQVIWCPDSTCFFLISNKVLYRVSLPDLGIQKIDDWLDREKIDASWIEK